MNYIQIKTLDSWVSERDREKKERAKEREGEIVCVILCMSIGVEIS